MVVKSKKQLTKTVSKGKGKTKSKSVWYTTSTTMKYEITFWERIMRFFGF